MSARLIYPNAESPLVSKRFLPVNNGVNNGVNKRGTKTSVNSYATIRERWNSI